MTTKLMGQKVQRVEDQRFLRGQGRYVDDVAVGGDVLHAAVLRSPHAHARIVDIDVADVLDLDFHRLQLEIYGFNERAIEHAERSGFVREGVKRKAYRRHGEWVDGVLFGLLREDLD